MIRGSIHVAVAAVLLSLLLHAAGLGVTSRDEQTPETEDRAVDVADVGSDFEDFASVMTESVEPEPTPVPEPPSVTSPEQVTEQAPMTQALVASDNPQDVTAPDTGTNDVIEPDAVDPSGSEATAPETTEPSGGEDGRGEDMAVLTPLEPDTEAEAPEGPQEATPEPTEPETAEAAPVPPVETVSPDASPETAISPEPEPLQPVPPEITVSPAPDDPETVTAQDNAEANSAAVTTSLRPPKERPPAPPPGASEAARAGRATGTIESPLAAYKRTGIDPFASGSGGTRSGTTGFSGSRNPGNASATNYAGQVLVQLNSFPPVDPSVRGEAHVSFGINADGTVAWINIMRSTGHPSIRRAAADQIRRAAPFPPPPEGASRRMVFSYERR